MWKKVVFAFLAPAILILLPVLLRQKESAIFQPSNTETDTIVVISPHPSPIKYEFEYAFRNHYRKTTGRDVKIDWRDIGGSSDIARYITSSYTAEFRNFWTKSGHKWDKETEVSFRLKNATTQARKEFLNSNVSIGIDIVFGGGTFTLSQIADAGFAVDGGVQKRHPEYFRDIPQNISSEQIYNPQGLFYGCCVCSFGIAYNPDRCKDANVQPPESWDDLAKPHFFQKIEIGDPTKSGSIMQCYEIILQHAMDRYPDDPNTGFQEGFRLIKLIAANSIYITDSASKLVHDVSNGTIMAGMSIDFYSFTETEWSQKYVGKPTLLYVMPANASIISADPAQLLRGAPNKQIAEMFLDFLISPEGMQIWCKKAGIPGGPHKFPLLRCPANEAVLKNTPRNERCFPDYNPFALADVHQKHSTRVSKYYSLLQQLIKRIALDPLDDLHNARQAILENGGDEANPDALECIAKLPFSFNQLADINDKINHASPTEKAAIMRGWTEFSIKQYRKATSLAKGGSK